jgi:CubicO group peptidase (beta-lactamase class C family)
MPMPRRWILLLACTVACNGGTDPSPDDNLPPLALDGATYWPDTGWRTASPSQVKMDSRALGALGDRLARGDVPGIHSLVVVRHGYVVIERYFNGSLRDDLHTLQSVTKSITSLVTGIALGEGRLRAADTVLRILPEYATLTGGDARKEAVTVHDLLTMRSGIDFYEDPYSGSPLQQLNNSRDDWVRIVLAQPMNAAPGARWQYNSGGVILLAGVVTRATGVAFDDYAATKLLTPIGITRYAWFRSPFDGLPHAGGGLNLRAIDLARIGYLVLRNGRWRDTQVVPAQWLGESMIPRTVRPRTLGSHVTDYGYLWWLLPLDRSGSTSSADNVIWTASGAFSQWLFVIPSQELVVAVTANTQSFSAPIDFLYNDILAAVR